MPKKPAIAYPIIATPLVTVGKFLLALRPSETLRIHTDGALLRAVLPLCDGNNPMIHIKKLLLSRWPSSRIDQLMANLQACGILAEADTIFSHWWPYVENPRKIGTNPSTIDIQHLPKQAANAAKKRIGLHYHQPPRSAFGALLNRRQSHRQFSGAAVPKRKLLAVLWATYGARRSIHFSRTVPSAGAIYALNIAYVNLKPTSDLQRGTYWVRYATDGTIALQTLLTDTDSVFRCFIDPNLLRRAQGVIFVIGAPHQAAKKYGNRSALYVGLEAGHAIQNALLAATEQNLHSVEIGGFYEAEIRTLLSLPTESMPLSSVVIGDSAPSWSSIGTLQAATPSTSFRWIEFTSKTYSPSFSIGVAHDTTKHNETHYCWGRDVKPLRAYDKAMAEATERRACSTPTGLYRARYDKLSNALDPRIVVDYQEVQHNAMNFPYAPFDEQKKYWWKDGVDHLGKQKTVAVLADLAYFGGSLPVAGTRRPYTGATTSGVAAYTSLDGAVEHAMLELIERDAFMRIWLGQGSSPQITLQTMPATIQKQIQSLITLGFRVMAKNITQELVPVIMVIAQSRTHGMTAIGAACHYRPETALAQALMEVDANVRVRLDNRLNEPITPTAVRTPVDHSNLYARRRYYRRADVLLKESSTMDLRTITPKARSWSGLQSQLAKQQRRLVVIDMTPSEASLDNGRVPLFVARVISPGLIPISFGYNTEPKGLQFVQQIITSSPHSRLRQPLFPHPFP